MRDKRGDVPGVDRPIRRDDIEDRLRALQGDVETVKESTLGVGIIAGGTAVLVLVVVAYLFGRRRGNKQYAFVEIRRV